MTLSQEQNWNRGLADEAKKTGPARTFGFTPV